MKSFPKKEVFLGKEKKSFTDQSLTCAEKSRFLSSNARTHVLTPSQPSPALEVGIEPETLESNELLIFISYDADLLSDKRDAGRRLGHKIALNLYFRFNKQIIFLEENR